MMDLKRFFIITVLCCTVLFFLAIVCIQIGRARTQYKAAAIEANACQQYLTDVMKAKRGDIESWRNNVKKTPRDEVVEEWMRTHDTHCFEEIIDSPDNSFDALPLPRPDGWNETVSHGREMPLEQQRKPFGSGGNCFLM
jgi:hypothetical protein